MKLYASITVIGRDQSGVIAKVTGFLFLQRANIEGLEEKVTRGQFGMTVQASWEANDCDVEHIKDGLTRLGRELGMEIKIRFVEPSRLQRFAILVTKETHCLEAIMAAVKKKELKAEPVIVIGNHPDLEPLARQHKLPYVHIPWHDRNKAEARTLRLLEKHEIDFVVLARFMKILSPTFVWHYKNKIINIHPSLLPAFTGLHTHQRAIDAGCKFAGCTVHQVTAELDVGPILDQAVVPVLPGDTAATLAARVLTQEHVVYPRAVAQLLSKM